METEKYKFKTELHMHTSPASSCGRVPPAEAVKRYKDIGYDSVVIVNHFFLQERFGGSKEKFMTAYLKDFDEACEAGAKLGINVILGCEIRFAECINDYLLYGIDREFLFEAYEYLDKGIENFSKNFKGGDMLILQAHPFRDGMTDFPSELLDGIETFNMHHGHNSRIAVAVKYAKEHNMITCAGSDFHDPGYEGLAAMLTKTKMTNSFEVADVLRKKDRIFEIGGAAIVLD